MEKKHEGEEDEAASEKLSNEILKTIWAKHWIRIAAWANENAEVHRQRNKL